jgi:hypothetical protein
VVDGCGTRRLSFMMRNRGTLKDCFAHFGATARNPRWSWSAISRDGNTVVITGPLPGLEILKIPGLSVCGAGRSLKPQMNPSLMTTFMESVV